MEDQETPRNEKGQPPTTTPEETKARLRQKEGQQTGTANRRRTEEQIDEVE